MEYDLKRLSAFLAVAETSSVSAAARSLHLAQPVVSRYIRQLEESIGVPLFDRSAKGATLTPEGHALLAHARRAVAAAEEWRDAAEAIGKGASGELKVAATGAWEPLLAPLITHFLRERPGVTLSFAVAPASVVLARVAQHEVHLGFLPFVPESKDFRVTLLGAEEYLAVAAPSVARQCGPAAAPHFPPSLHLINPSDHLPLPGPMRDYSGRVPLRNLPSMRVDSLGAVREVVKGGVGVAVMPKRSVARDLATGELAPLFPELRPLLVPRCAVEDLRRRSGPNERAFLQHVSQAVASSTSLP